MERNQITVLKVENVQMCITELRNMNTGPEVVCIYFSLGQQLRPYLNSNHNFFSNHKF